MSNAPLERRSILGSLIERDIQSAKKKKKDLADAKEKEYRQYLE